MTNPTSNFGWQMPTSTDLVTDLPADFEVFGQAVDTSMADLKGGTTGQILSKATNADMDFTWITNDVGDITAVTVSSPLTGGGTSGSVSVGILSGTTSNLGAVQLSDSTSSTSTTLAATANAVKTSYDLANTANTAAGTAQTTANAAIPKSTVTTAGDVIYATGSAAVTRLGIGTAGQVLTVNSGATAPEWTTVSATPTYSGCAIYKTSTQSTANGVATSVTYDGEYLDTNGYHSTSSNTSRITIPSGKAGKYLVTGNLQFASIISANIVLFLVKNGAQIVTSQYPQQSINYSSGATTLNVSAIVDCAVGDYLEIQAFQGSGGNQDVSANRNWFTASLLGA